MKPLQTKFDLLTHKPDRGRVRQKRRTRHEEGRKGQRYHYQCVFLENTRLATTIFKGHADSIFRFKLIGY